MNSPYTYWICATERLKEHTQFSDIHKLSLLTMQMFQNGKKSKVKPVNQIYNEASDRVVTANKHTLLSILKTVILCAKQNNPSLWAKG